MPCPIAFSTWPKCILTYSFHSLAHPIRSTPRPPHSLRSQWIFRNQTKKWEQQIEQTKQAKTSSVTVPVPIAMRGHGMADMANGYEVVLFGGQDSSRDGLSDTWIYTREGGGDGMMHPGWSLCSFDVKPSMRYSHAMSRLGTSVFLFGGLATNENSGGTGTTAKDDSWMLYPIFKEAQLTPHTGGGGGGNSGGGGPAPLTCGDRMRWVELKQSTDVPLPRMTSMGAVGSSLAVLFGGHVAAYVASSDITVVNGSDTWVMNAACPSGMKKATCSDPELGCTACALCEVGTFADMPNDMKVCSNCPPGTSPGY